MCDWQASQLPEFSFFVDTRSLKIEANSLVVRVYVVHLLRSAWARYNEARTGQIRLIPAAKRLASLRVDYDKMKDMFFGERPPFDDVLNTLAVLEERVNARTAEQGANI